MFDKEAEMETKVYSAPDIECEGCANAIRKAVGKVDGVQSVHVDVDHKEVSVTFGAPATEGQVVGALDKAGFPVA
jgi:copper chaperone